MAVKLLIAILVLFVAVTTIDAMPMKGMAKSMVKREIVKCFAKREPKPLNRDEFLQIVRTLTEDDIAKMTVEQKINLLFLIYYFGVQPEELGIRGSEKFSREDFIQNLRTLIDDDFPKMTVDQKINLLFLIYYFGVQSEELGYIDPEIYSREAFIAELRTLTEDDFAKMTVDQKIGVLFFIQYFRPQPEELGNHEAIAKRDSEEFSREDFVDYLRMLTEDDVAKMSDEEKIGLLFLIYLFKVEPHEFEKRESNFRIN